MRHPLCKRVFRRGSNTDKTANMDIQIHWDEGRREVNIQRHGLDFMDAALVLDRAYRLDVESVKEGQWWTRSFAYVFDVLTVLTFVHVLGQQALKIISFRPASKEEREAYHDWLENDFHDAH